MVRNKLVILSAWSPLRKHLYDKDLFCPALNRIYPSPECLFMSIYHGYCHWTLRRGKRFLYKDYDYCHEGLYLEVENIDIYVDRPISVQRSNCLDTTTPQDRITVKADLSSYKRPPFFCFNIKSISVHPYYSRWMSCLISFVWSSPGCEQRSVSENFKMIMYASAGNRTRDPLLSSVSL